MSKAKSKLNSIFNPRVTRSFSNDFRNINKVSPNSKLRECTVCYAILDFGKVEGTLCQYCIAETQRHTKSISKILHSDILFIKELQASLKKRAKYIPKDVIKEIAIALASREHSEVDSKHSGYKLRRVRFHNIYLLLDAFYKVPFDTTVHYVGFTPHDVEPTRAYRITIGPGDLPMLKRISITDYKTGEIQIESHFNAETPCDELIFIVLGILRTKYIRLERSDEDMIESMELFYSAGAITKNDIERLNNRSIIDPR